MDVKFRTLYGAHGGGAFSCLLQIEGFNFLLDCGWGDPYETKDLYPLLEIIGSIDAGKV